jgi:prophage antirepressor-like protein
MNSIKIFESKQIRSVWNEKEGKWYFSVQDVIETLTSSRNIKDYIKKLKKRDSLLNSDWGTICPLVVMPTPDGMFRKIQAANTEGLFRIIQSIPSSKAEPFKRWLAKVGYERIEEIENPEKAVQRSRELYKAKGYPDDWIEKRMRSIAIQVSRKQVCAETEKP